MSINVNDAIDGAKNIFENNPGNLVKHETFCPVYAWTNESVCNALDFADAYGRQKALSVLASGDQVFSMLDYKINDIDTFDINALTEYYALGLKRAMILKYDYFTFIKTMEKIFSTATSNEEIYEIIKGLFPYMEKRHSFFWQELIDYDALFRKKRIGYERKNLIISLTFANRSVYYLSEDVLYLMNEQYYNIAKDNLSKANISFKTVDAQEVDRHFTGPYDFIYLSNVLDFFDSFGSNWGYDKLREYEEKVKKLADKDASIVLKYALDYPYPQSLFRNACVGIEKSFQDEELFRFGNSRDCRDAIVLVRTK